MQSYLTAVKNDLFDIASRLKEIDDGYEVFFDRKRNRYEVHNNRQKGNTFCLVVPFDGLDARTVDLVRRTRVENADRLFAELDEQDRRREKEGCAKEIL